MSLSNDIRKLRRELEERIGLLSRELEALKEEASGSLTPEKAAYYEKATEELLSLGIERRALKPGESAPDFGLSNVRGEPIRLSEVLASGPVVLSFFRGEWCPYCTLEMKYWQKYLGELRDSGAELLAISPQTRERNAEMAHRLKLGFEVLTDHNNEVSRAYGVAYKLPELQQEILRDGETNLTVYNDAPPDELPSPATFVVAPDGAVIFAFVDSDYSHRAEPLDVIAAIHKWSAQGPV